MTGMIDLLTPAEVLSITQTVDSGTVQLAAAHLGKQANAVWVARSRARAKLKAAGFDLPDLRKQKRSGCRRIPSIPISQ